MLLSGPPMVQTRTPALTFGTRERTSIAIGSATYPLRHPDDMSLAMGMRYRRTTPRFSALFAEGDRRDLTAAEEQELSGLLAQLFEMALDAPPDAVAGLADGEKLAIVLVAFFRVPPAELAAAAATEASETTAPAAPPTTNLQTPATPTRTRKRTSSRG